MKIQIQDKRNPVASAHWSFRINPTCEKSCAKYKIQIQKIIQEIQDQPVLQMDVASAHWSFKIRRVKAAASATTAAMPGQ